VKHHQQEDGRDKLFLLNTKRFQETHVPIRRTDGRIVKFLDQSEVLTEDRLIGAEMTEDARRPERN
jgi:hypothetical protein